jgi:hypothetical protein
MGTAARLCPEIQRLGRVSATGQPADMVIQRQMVHPCKGDAAVQRRYTEEGVLS